MARKIRPDDLPMIRNWITEREGQAPEEWVYPSTGRIVDGIAAGFLYRTDSGLGLMELFVSNPESDGLRAGRAIESVADAILEDAKESGIKGLMVMTRTKSIRQCAQRRNFVEEVGPWSVLVRRV